MKAPNKQIKVKIEMEHESCVVNKHIEPHPNMGRFTSDMIPNTLFTKRKYFKRASFKQPPRRYL